MLGWAADYTNDPNNDYELVIEILYNDLDVGMICMGEKGLVLKWYASQVDINVPLDWFANLLSKARTDLKLTPKKINEVEEDKSK